MWIFKKTSLLLLIAVSSCAIVNLDTIEVDTYPAEREAVLAADTPVWMEFSTPVDKAVVEELFSVLSPTGRKQGDFSWQGNRLVYTPRSSYEPGVRYVLSINGEVKAEDGRRRTVSVAVPFFSVTNGLPAHLAGAVPADGAMTDGGSSLTLTFTKSMDTAMSIEDVFSLSPTCAFTHRWQTDGTELVIQAQSGWTPYTLYRWTITTELRDAMGIALSREYEGNFLVQNAAAPAPRVGSLQPAFNSWALLFPPVPGRAELTGAADRQEEWIGYEDAIRIVFQTPDHPLPDDPARVNLPSLQKAFTIEPAVGGTIQCVKTIDNRDDFFVFIPNPGQRFLMNTLYHVRISRDLQNMEGAALEADFNGWFSVDCPVISVERIIISHEDQPALEYPVDKSLFNSYLEHDLAILEEYSPDYFHIIFNDDFQIEAADSYAIADDIQLTRIFPVVGGPYARRNVIYSSGSPPTLTIAYADVPAAAGTIFRLQIKGGPQGVVDDHGSYLPNDIFIYFKLHED